MKTIKITKAWAGRQVGDVVKMYDETLAADVVAAGHAEYIDDPPPVEDRAMGRSPRGRE